MKMTETEMTEVLRQDKPNVADRWIIFSEKIFFYVLFCKQRKVTDKLFLCTDYICTSLITVLRIKCVCCLEIIFHMIKGLPYNPTQFNI